MQMMPSSESESLHTIPSATILEGFDENTKIDELEKADWGPKLSMLNQFMMVTGSKSFFKII